MPAPTPVRTAEELYGYGSAFAEYEAFEAALTATGWLTPAEAARLWPPLGVYAASVDPRRFEAAIAASGLRIGQRIQLGGQ